MSPPPRNDAFNPSGVLAGEQAMPQGNFLHYLLCATWSRLVRAWRLDTRTFAQGEEVPLDGNDGLVYILLGGCVVQECFPFGAGRNAPAVVRFRGVGEFFGEAKLIEATAQVRTVCLSTTWVMTCPVHHMNVILRRHPDVQLALLHCRGPLTVATLR
ncbi:hypothetical protein [Streptomyces sp. NPDC053069]|uniref:hypothetical protein n=1 Tax=Streptomyces sp. NPDC053069 TaxID=3365695 RepID=UPI0037CE8C31